MLGRLRVGLVGTGFIGSVHARSIHAAGAELVGVAASTPRHSEEAAERLGASRGFPTALDLVTDDGVDVVHVASPNDLHCELSMAALAAGKHVVCEKPLALSTSDAERLQEAARAAGLVGAVPFVNRFHPMAREARERLSRGEHGMVHSIHGSYLQDWMLDPDETNWRVDPERGGPSRAFADIGSHWCDLAEWMTGELITELVATTSTTVAERPVTSRPTFSTEPPESTGERSEVGTEDVACVLFRTAGGASGVLTVSQVAAARKNRLWIEIDGDRRSVVFDQENPELLWVGTQAGAEIVAREAGLLSAEVRPYSVLPAGHVQGFHDCFDAFVRDVYRSVGQGYLVDGLPTFADGARAARIVDAVLASATKHSWIEV